MALTIHQTPENYTPSDNPITWTFSSTLTANDNFFYKVTVFVNDVEVSVEQVLPENGVNAKFNASAWASNACGIPNISNTLIEDAENYAQIKINVTEVYGDPLADDDSVTTANITAWKARIDDDSFESWAAIDYTYGLPASKWLTQFPTTSNPKCSTSEQIRFMMINNLNNVTVLVRLVDSDNILVASDTFNIVSTAFRLLILRVDPTILVSSTALTDSDFDASLYYTIQVVGAMEEFRIDIDRECTYRTYKRVHFMSRIGSIESFSFGLISRRRGKIKSFGYQKTFGQWVGDQFVYTDDQGRDIDFAKTTEYEMECISDWLFEDVQHWLVNNCHTSPLFYLEENVNLIKRRKIKNTSFKEDIQENDMLFLEKIIIQLPTITSATV